MTLLLGCDFSSSPSRRKNIVLATGELAHGRIRLTRLERLESLDAFSQWLQEPRRWVGAFDLPFGLPRELVLAMEWPLQWEPCVRHYAALERAEIRSRFAAFCAARPVGGKFAHRVTDLPAKASPSMKWVNPPVAYMLHAGVPRMLEAGVHFVRLQPPLSALELAEGPATRIALEGYPGLLAREVLGSRSYKSDDKAKHTPERLIARKDVVTALEIGQTRLKLQLKLSHAQREALIADPSGDALDAVLCLVQAAWGWEQFQAGDVRFGLPEAMDPLEGWILSA